MEQMKFYGISALLVIVLTASLFAQSELRVVKEEILNLPVTELQIEARNIQLLLSELAYKYSVNISLEVAFDDDLLSGDPLRINVKKGTLADVIENTVAQRPSYTWEFSDGVIVFPKNDFRDPLLPALLQTKIGRLYFHRGQPDLLSKKS
jgi:hypothetical protein